ncbi:hypothetical protein LPTSP4_16990 [Leptospira ryugenii]|uniref:Uncharacterized protein n=1 Tax=Leptospira ryugenii TaxID=1917863 RepID=A0A2P2DZX5_9LEPT|nr:hypothetical protein [Leptospira ryugenii]GBF50175.1 hypothetical protein LPTSP4_16990 [Leptospira ryugenii]
MKSFRFIYLLHGIVVILVSLFAVFLIGKLQWESSEKDFSPKAMQLDSKSLEKISLSIEYAIRVQNYKSLERVLRQYENSIGVIVVSLSNSNSFESHQDFKTAKYAKRLWEASIQLDAAIYDYSIYQMERKAWKREYLSWLKYMFDTLKRKNHHRFYLTYYFLLSLITLAGLDFLIFKFKLVK